MILWFSLLFLFLSPTFFSFWVLCWPFVTFVIFSVDCWAHASFWSHTSYICVKCFGWKSVLTSLPEYLNCRSLSLKDGLASLSYWAVAICVGLRVTFLFFILLRACRLWYLLIFLCLYIRSILVHYLILIQRAHLCLLCECCDWESSEFVNDYLDDGASDDVGRDN